MLKGNDIACQETTTLFNLVRRRLADFLPGEEGGRLAPGMNTPAHLRPYWLVVVVGWLACSWNL